MNLGRVDWFYTKERLVPKSQILNLNEESIQKVQFTKMSKEKASIVLLFVVAVALGDKLFVKSEGTCCSACREKNAFQSVFSPTNFKTMTINLMKYNMSMGLIVNSLTNFPPYYTQFLYGRLNDLKQRAEIGAFQCIRDTSSDDSSLKASTEADNVTINVMFDSTIETIKKNLYNESPNYINTFAKLIQDLKKYYNNIDATNLYSPNYLNVSPEQAENRAKITGVSFNTVMHLQFGALEQGYVDQDMQDVSNMCFSTRNNGTSSRCLNYVYDHDYTSNANLKSWSPRYKARVPNGKISKLYYYWRSTLQKPTTQLEDFDNFKFYDQDLSASENTEFDAYSIAIQNKKNGEPSALDFNSLDWVLKTTFNGQIVPPEFGTIQQGYAPGENQFTVWAKIATTMLSPLIYCKYPTLIDSLALSCPTTCNDQC